MILNKFILVSLLAATTVMAHMTVSLNAYAEARSLHAIMKQMGGTLGLIAKPVMQGTATAKEAELAHQLLGLVDEAVLVLPDAIINSPAAEQPQKTQRYQELMGQLHTAVEDLESAIAANDMPRAQATLKKVGALRSVGHQEFKI